MVALQLKQTLVAILALSQIYAGFSAPSITPAKPAVDFMGHLKFELKDMEKGHVVKKIEMGPDDKNLKVLFDSAFTDATAKLKYNSACIFKYDDKTFELYQVTEAVNQNIIKITFSDGTKSSEVKTEKITINAKMAKVLADDELKKADIYFDNPPIYDPAADYEIKFEDKTKSATTNKLRVALCKEGTEDCLLSDELDTTTTSRVVDGVTFKKDAGKITVVKNDDFHTKILGSKIMIALFEGTAKTLMVTRGTGIIQQKSYVTFDSCKSRLVTWKVEPADVVTQIMIYVYAAGEKETAFEKIATCTKANEATPDCKMESKAEDRYEKVTKTTISIKSASTQKQHLFKFVGKKEWIKTKPVADALMGFVFADLNASGCGGNSLGTILAIVIPISIVVVIGIGATIFFFMRKS